MAARREDALRLTGSGGANRVMEAELKRLVMRSPFEVRVEKPRREGDFTLLYPFDARVAWVASCHHRTSSRVTWDLASSRATRLEPLFDELREAFAAEDRLGAPGRLAISVDVGPVADFEAGPLQVRGVVKNAAVEGLARRGVSVEVDARAPDVELVVRRAGQPESRRTLVSLDLGGGARHLRGTRVAGASAPLRETLAAQLVMESRWDARTEPLVDPMAGGGTIVMEAAALAAGRAVRQPGELPLGRLPAFEGLPREAPDLFPGTVPRLLALDVDAERVPAMIGNLRAAGLTGPELERSIVVGRQDARALTPDVVRALLPASRDMGPGVFAFNPPYGVRLGGGGEAELLGLYRDVGRALARFPGWRAAVFVANPRFVEAFGHAPVMTKPASNAELRGAFLLFSL